MLVAAVVLNASLFGLLLWHTIDEGSVATGVTLLVVFLSSFVFEKTFRMATGRTMKAEAAPSVAAPGHPHPDARRGDHSATDQMT